MSMFLETALSSDQVQNIALILNTVLLIGALITVELLYSEQPKAKRKQLYYFLPLILILGALLIYAAYKQQGGM